ncbi:MAG TPA: sigma-54 dependent transcriptional regulator [Methylomusa anaerophila]|uniref:sigma-54-dependent transcriptional regulator n=1 Tax=Methylomusa anaerophila TaxID=1930071 RepID=UPI002B7294CE|nr:sigma-54 dependent transcriptional regulator [Methylomusa anaerophila]HML87969.1 sigma-54 dependent transcriptional regulator [Methylomusa anaerophila]
MNILLVDDDARSRAGVAKFLWEMGHHVTECCDGEEAWATYTASAFPMVLSDIKMPRLSGIELLSRITALPGRKADVVLFTGHGDMTTAIQALRAGAYDYLLKPINVEELATITDKVAEHQALLYENKVLTERFSDEVQAATEETRQELSRLKRALSQAAGLENIGFFSKQMQDIVQQAQKYHTNRSIPVLVEGETGTGKEIISRIIHYGNMDGETDDQTPFIDVNCAAISANLFESELFGYEPGAFTGSLTKGQKGKLDLAQGGTLLLDEVGEIPLELQGKLLRVLQEKEFYRVGGLKKIKTDVRIICATNADLEQRVEQGTFRRDLYFRLKVGHFLIPPLRQRRDDIIPLSEMFLRQFTGKKANRFQRISDSAAALLLNYNWPGNIRELRNTMEWVSFMYDDAELKPAHLAHLHNNPQPSLSSADNGQAFIPEKFTLPASGFSLEEYVDQIIAQAIEICQGNKTAAAMRLGISRRSLYSRLKKVKGK